MKNITQGGENMEQDKQLPLGRVEDPEELKARYRIFSSETLARWAALVKGPHREAMLAVLAERNSPP